MTGRRRRRWLLVVLVLAAAAAACGEGGDDRGEVVADTAPDAGPTTVTVPPTTAPLPFPEAMEARLADELGDADLAAELMTAIGPDSVGRFEAAIGDDVATTPLLAYRPATVPADEVDSLVVFAFGNRVAPGGALSPGPVNEALAAATAAFVEDHPVPVVAQWEVADLLLADGVDDVISVEPDEGPDGEVVYLSTAGVADKAVRLADDAGIDLGRVGVVCFADHAGRCLLTAEAAGMTGAAVPAGVALPDGYDPGSGQPWTRDRAAYLVTDLTGRLLLAEG